MKKYLLGLLLCVTLVIPVTANDNLVSLKYEIPFGSGFQYEGTIGDNIYGGYYSNLKGDIGTTKVEITTFGLDWVSYGKNFSGFYWGAGASYNTINLKQNLLVEYEANILYPYLNGGYSLLIGNFNAKLGAKVGYGFGELELKAGNQSIKSDWDPKGFLPSIYFSLGFAF